MLRRVLPRFAFAAIPILAASCLAGAALAVVQAPARADAFTGADFDPGNIISDVNFFNPHALTAEQVQAFIDSKVTCDAGAVCLANLHVDTFDIPATPMCSAYQGASQESAATIIFKVGKACGISQAVILVILQKEQSLVTASAPSVYALSAAMGAGCYDNGQPCIDQYAGFFNQVFNGAYLLKRYTQPAGTGPGTPYTSRYDLAYPVGQLSNILQAPGCGTLPVFVTNQATHSLYVYTPYTPNAAALANLYGTGDDCSTYGNRNFWTLFYNWFGNPQLPVAGQGTFADVPDPTSQFYTYIEWMASQGISTGTAQPTDKPLYKPVDAVSRQAMALFMYRLSGETFTPPAQPTFADVAPGTQFYTAVEWMAARGISLGTAQASGSPLFKPTDPVSRQAMAIFLARYDHVNISTPPVSQSFADVPLNNPAAAAAKWLSDTGISTGTTQPSGLPLFNPADPVSRQAMAAFLYRLAHLAS